MYIGRLRRSTRQYQPHIDIPIRAFDHRGTSHYALLASEDHLMDLVFVHITHISVPVVPALGRPFISRAQVPVCSKPTRIQNIPLTTLSRKRGGGGESQKATPFRDETSSLSRSDRLKQVTQRDPHPAFQSRRLLSQRRVVV
jgi:hypothetical protein